MKGCVSMSRKSNAGVCSACGLNCLRRKPRQPLKLRRVRSTRRVRRLWFARSQEIAAETGLIVEPGSRQLESTLRGQRRQVFEAVFVRLLHVNSLAGFERQHQVEAANGDSLRSQTLNVNLDPAGCFVIDGS